MLCPDQLEGAAADLFAALPPMIPERLETQHWTLRCFTELAKMCILDEEKKCFLLPKTRRMLWSPTNKRLRTVSEWLYRSCVEKAPVMSRQVGGWRMVSTCTPADPQFFCINPLHQKHLLRTRTKWGSRDRGTKRRLVDVCAEKPDKRCNSGKSINDSSFTLPTKESCESILNQVGWLLRKNDVKMSNSTFPPTTT